MGANDRQVRNEYVTVRGGVFGHNYKDDTEYDLTVGAYTPSGGSSDLCQLVGISPTTGLPATPDPAGYVVIRILQPYYGEVVEAYLDQYLHTFAIDGSIPGMISKFPSTRIFIGDFLNNDFTTPRTSYTQQEAIDGWRKLTGKTAGIGQNVTWQTNIQKLNLLPGLYKKGHAKFVEDGFCIVIQYSDGFGEVGAGINGGSNFSLNFFRVALAITGIR